MTNDKLREALHVQLDAFLNGSNGRMGMATWMCYNAHEILAALAAPVEAEPVAQVTLTMPEATALLDCYGGEEADITVRHFAATVDEETGEPMPAGYYAIFADYPEEGRLYLDPARPAEQGKDAEDAARLDWLLDNAPYIPLKRPHDPTLASNDRAAIDAARNSTKGE